MRTIRPFPNTYGRKRPTTSPASRCCEAGSARVSPIFGVLCHFGSRLRRLQSFAERGPWESSEPSESSARLRRGAQPFSEDSRYRRAGAQPSLPFDSPDPWKAHETRGGLLSRSDKLPGTVSRTRTHLLRAGI